MPLFGVYDAAMDEQNQKIFQKIQKEIHLKRDRLNCYILKKNINLFPLKFKLYFSLKLFYYTYMQKKAMRYACKK